MRVLKAQQTVGKEVRSKGNRDLKGRRGSRDAFNGLRFVLNERENVTFVKRDPRLGYCSSFSMD